MAIDDARHRVEQVVVERAAQRVVVARVAVYAFAVRGAVHAPVVQGGEGTGWVVVAEGLRGWEGAGAFRGL